MLQGEVLILEFVSIDALSASPVVSSKVSSLEHEVRDDTMERARLVAVAFLAGT